MAANPDAAMDAPAPEEEKKQPAAASGPKKAGIRGGAATTKAAAASKAGVTRNTESAAKPVATPEKKVAAASATTRKTVPSKNATMQPKIAAPFQEEPEAFTITVGNKERRALADSKSKWVPDDIKPQHATAAKKHSEEIFGAEVAGMMWSSDFKKHMQVIGKMLTLFTSQP